MTFFTEADRLFYISLNLPDPTEEIPDHPDHSIAEGGRIGTFFMVDAHGDQTLGTPQDCIRVSEMPVSELLQG